MLKLLRIPSFRSLLAGQALASASHQVAAFALPTLAITRLNATALEVGVLTALAFIPTTVFGFLVGVFADRLPQIGEFFYSQTRTGAFATEATNTFRYAPATVARRLSTVCGFYRTLVIDGLLAASPAE